MGTSSFTDFAGDTSFFVSGVDKDSDSRAGTSEA